ncbi:SDR family NAD(P)-dependent oxidoreductase [Endothiovibrio diazotrophicus]
MAFADFFKDKNVLVTGVAGTVGLALAKRLSGLGVASLAGLDNNESGLFMVQHLLGDGFRAVLGDIRDRDRLTSAFAGCDVVFHAAALKHVPLCEQHPLEAVQTNILGTQNVVHAAMAAEVPRVVYTSTDKAVNPPNVMGASKLMGEHLMKAANVAAAGQVFSSTRFGNVLGSRGSVLPVFHRQIRSGGPLTLTSREMTRFVMTLEKSVDLVLEAANIARGGETMITKMATVRIADLAEVMIEALAPRYGHRPESIEIIESGPRPGEKLYEELMNVEEVRRSVELENHFVVLPALTDFYEVQASDYPGLRPGELVRPYNSANEVPMGKAELREYLENTGLLDGEEVA